MSFSGSNYGSEYYSHRIYASYDEFGNSKDTLWQAEQLRINLRNRRKEHPREYLEYLIRNSRTDEEIAKEFEGIDVDYNKVREEMALEHLNKLLRDGSPYWIARDLGRELKCLSRTQVIDELRKHNITQADIDKILKIADTESGGKK